MFLWWNHNPSRYHLNRAISFPDSSCTSILYCMYCCTTVIVAPTLAVASTNNSKGRAAYVSVWATNAHQELFIFCLQPLNLTRSRPVQEYIYVYQYYISHLEWQVAQRYDQKSRFVKTPNLPPPSSRSCLFPHRHKPLQQYLLWTCQSTVLIHSEVRKRRETGLL